MEEAIEEDKAIIGMGQTEFEDKVANLVNRKVKHAIQKNSKKLFGRRCHHSLEKYKQWRQWKRFQQKQKGESSTAQERKAKEEGGGQRETKKKTLTTKRKKAQRKMDSEETALEEMESKERPQANLSTTNHLPY